MGSDFVSDLMGRVNGIGERFVSATYGSLGGSLQTAFTAALTIYVAWWGIQLVIGRAGVSAADIVWRVGRACLLYALVFSWSTFELLVFEVADKVPTAIGKVILNGVTGSFSDPTQALSDVWHAAQKASERMVAAAGFRNIGLYIMAAVTIIFAAFFVGFALALLILAKLATWVLLAVGPFFIALALFAVTSRFFTGWAAQVASFALIPLFVYAFLGFFLSLIQQIVDDLARHADEGSLSWTYVAPFILLTLIGTLVLTQVNTIAAGIAGGATLREPNFLGMMTKGATAPFQGAATMLRRRQFRSRALAMREGQDARYAAIAHTINPETGRDVFIEALKNTRRLRLPKD